MNCCGWLWVSHFLKNEKNDFSSLALTKRASISASTADTATNLTRDVRMCTSSFIFIGYLSWGSHPKKNPAVQLFALVE